jgi:hypothetical protein
MRWIHYWILVLANPWYKYGFLAFVATFVSLLLKLSSRPDTLKMQLEDWAVGFDLAQVAIFALLTDAVAEVVRAIVVEGKIEFDLATVERLIALPSLLGGMIIFLFFVALLVRKHGWQTVGAELRLNRGGALGPIPVGLIYLAVCILFIGGQ